MLKKIKNWVKKYNELNNTFINVVSGNGQIEININDYLSIGFDDEMLYFHYSGQINNHNWIFFEKLNKSVLFRYIDNIFYDMENGII